MKTLGATLLFLLLTSTLLVPGLAQQTPAPGADAAEEASNEEEQLRRMIRDLALLEQDPDELDRAKAEIEGCWLGGAEVKIFERGLRLQASIAKAKREGRFESPALHRKFVTQILGPFVRIREKVRRRCDHRKTRGAFDERDFLDLMLDEYAAGHHANVVALGKTVPEPGSYERPPNSLVLELRRQMKELAEKAAGQK